MGKKKPSSSKKKKSNNAKSKARRNLVGENEQSGNNTGTGAHHRKTQDEEAASRRSMYTVYKFCTDSVFEWGITTYDKLTKSQNQKKKASSSLSRLFYQYLGTLAKAGVSMPHTVLTSLRTAISYRKRVARYYWAIPTVSQESYARHQWVIDQLSRFETKFSRNIQQDLEQGQSTDPSHQLDANRFALLSLSDDGDEESDDEQNNDESAKQSEIKHKKEKRIVPTDQELEEEERTFALALVLAQTADGRDNLKNVWREWAQFRSSSGTSGNDDADAAELFAATACTGYTLVALKKLVMQSSLEFGDDAFLHILRTTQVDNNAPMGKDEAEQSFAVNDCVTLQNLEKRPDLNGRHGRIVKPSDAASGGRLGVELFPTDPTAYNLGNSRDAAPILSMKPDNLFLSDNICLRLNQVYEALTSFSSNADIPKPPEFHVGVPPSSSVQQAGVEVLLNISDFENTLRKKDFCGYLQLIVKRALPLLISLSRYFPVTHFASTALIGFAREFDETRKVTFHFALSILVAIDCAQAIFEVNKDRADNARDMFVANIERAFNSKTYQQGIDLMTSFKYKPGALYSHFEITRHCSNEYSALATIMPCLCGELLLDCFRLHFVCGSGFPYSFDSECTRMLHLYWMLRSEGFLGKLRGIEKTLIRMYRQKVWFRAGLPQRGQESYFKSWQLAEGVSATAAALLDGRQTTRRTPHLLSKKDFDMTGLHVTEISRLLEILQWKTMPTSADFESTNQRIREIAKEEYFTIFTAPLMETCISLLQLRTILASQVLQIAVASGRGMIDHYDARTKQMTDESKVCFWGLSLADDRSLDRTEKKRGLEMLANCFRQVFDDEDVGSLSDQSEPSLTFCNYTHEVDKALWGEKGVASMAHS